MSVFDDVLSFIEHPQPALFDELAMRVFTFQTEQIDAYSKFLRISGVDCKKINKVADIPPISTQAFKYARLRSEASGDGLEFLTSGTTAGREQRGRHFVPRPEVYRTSAISHLRRMLFPDQRRMAMIALHPTADRMPESSLSHMISWAIEEFADDSIHCAATRHSIDIDGAIEFLRRCERRSQPVCIMATTAACAKLLDQIAQHDGLRLPGGSRLMDTGGPKGQVTPLTPDEVCQLASERLGIDADMVINEYGMTEMCSQLYDATSLNSRRNDSANARLKIGPPWLRAFAFDPATLKPLPNNQVGLLGFFDLANVGSVSMIVTEDLGLVGDAGVRIIGRAGSAEARGCALGIEEFQAGKLGGA